MRKEIEEILKLLRGAKKVLVTSHQDPDGDSIGSQLAMGSLVQKMGKKVMIASQGFLPSKYSFLDPEGRIILEKREEVLKLDPDLVVALECPYLGRIGWVKEAIGKRAKIVNIDHHPDNTSFGDVNFLDHTAAAVGEMVYTIMLKAGYSIEVDEANWIYAAIMTDTGRFRYSSTTPRSLKVCAQLVELGADPKHLTDQIYFSITPQGFRMLTHVLSGMELFDSGKISCMTVENEFLAKFQVSPADTEGLVDYSLFIKGVQVGALFKEVNPGRTKVSLRSQNHLDIGELARQFGGGGHKNASGFAMDKSLKETKELIITELKKWI